MWLDIHTQTYLHIYIHIYTHSEICYYQKNYEYQMRAEQLELDWHIVLYCNDSAQEYLFSSQRQNVSPSQLERLGRLSHLCFLLSTYDDTKGYTFIRKMLWIRIAAFFLNFP